MHLNVESFIYLNDKFLIRVKNISQKLHAILDSFFQTQNAVIKQLYNYLRIKIIVSNLNDNFFIRFFN